MILAMKPKYENDRPTFYFKEDSNRPIRAGGVLFYRRDKNRTNVLMIKNRGRYEDFGGRTDAIDTSIEDTIAREVEEESNGIFNSVEIKSYLKDKNTISIHNSKYLLYFVELDKYYDPELFGDKEIHDNINRTVEWVSYDKLTNKDFINNFLHYRLKNKNFFDGLKRCIPQFVN